MIRPIILTTIVDRFLRKSGQTLNDRFGSGKTTLNEKLTKRKSVNEFYEEREQERAASHQRPKPISDLNMEAIFGRRRKKRQSAVKKEFRYFFSMFSSSDKALILTLLILFGTVVTLMAMQLNDMPKEIMIEMALTPEDLPYEPPKLEEQPQADLPLEHSTARLTTSAYNEANAELQHSDMFKSLDELMAERAAQEMESAKEELVNVKSPNTNIVLPADNDMQKTLEKPQQSNKANKNTLVKYALTGRTGNIPNPIFTCEKQGTVVVIITVDDTGRVIRTALDKINSTTTDDCLIENSLQYAQRARFNAVTGKKEQTGTITYTFQSKR